MKESQIKPEDIIVGTDYHLNGDIENGFWEGKPFISHEEVTRKVTRVTDTHVICECSRKFLRNENLIITIPHYRRNEKK
jgi:hypothetical protein